VLDNEKTLRDENTNKVIVYEGNSILPNFEKGKKLKLVDDNNNILFEKEIIAIHQYTFYSPNLKSVVHFQYQ
jgi:co-chaperonin GroES (HSP10)